MTTKKANKKTPIIVGLLLAALLLLPYIPPVAADEVSSAVGRSMPSLVACGDEVTVTLHIDWGDATAVFIEESYPSGWGVVSSSHGGSSADAGKVKWHLNDPSVSQVSYVLAVPVDAEDEYAFSGAFRDDLMSPGTPDRAIAGPASISVACPASEVTRAALPPMTCGATYTIQLNIQWHETNKRALAVEEQPPSGWTILSASNGGSMETDGTVKWFLNQTEVVQVTYEVKVPDDAVGTYLFSGLYRDDGMGKDGPSAMIGGYEQADVSCGADVTRSGLSPQQCGQTFTVTLALGWSGAESMFIEESYPMGWTVTSASHSGNLGTEGMVKWFISDPAVSAVTYQLNIPGQAEGSFGFTGGFRDDTMAIDDASKAIIGQSTVSVSCGSTAPPPPPPEDGAHAERSAPSTLHPQSMTDQSILVTITLTWNDATTMTLRESVPGPNVEASQISNGGSIVAGKIQWDLSDPSITMVSYRLSVPSSSDLTAFGERTFAGTVMDDVKTTEASIVGASGFTVLHRFDSTKDCLFSDTNLFTVIDAWKSSSATDNELFSGIDAWKRSPGSYCTN